MLFNQIQVDYLHYYSIEGLKRPLGGFILGSMTANTDFDSLFQDQWQNKWRNQTFDQIADNIDDYSHYAHPQYSLPIYILALWFPNSAIQQWSDHCLRMLAMGVPQHALLTSLLGSSRPEQHKSQWHPFEYHRGVSGHAFYGAIPFLAIAEQQQSFAPKTLFYCLSTFPGWARINNNKHYFTQAFLGWWLAYSALKNIHYTDQKTQQTTLEFQAYSDGFYLGVHRKF